MKKEKSKSKKIVFIVLGIVFFISIIVNVTLFYKHNKVVYKNDENIVFFGDSITEQYDVKKFYPNNNVINSGIGGNKTENLIDRISKDVYNYNPSKVFLLIGINDLCTNVEKDDYLYNLQVIINGLKSNRKYAKIYVESIYPFNPEKLRSSGLPYCTNTSNKEIISINREIEEICEESDVTYIDLYSELVDENGSLKDLYTKEGLHLNNLGYLKVTSVLDKYINE